MFSQGPGLVVETIGSPDDVMSQSSKSDKDSGVSAGAIAGGVAGGVAILAVIAFGVWLCLRRRRRRIADEPSDTKAIIETQRSPPDYHQLDADIPRAGGKSEMMGSKPPVELFTGSREYEAHELVSPDQAQGPMLGSRPEQGGFRRYGQEPQELDTPVRAYAGTKSSNSRPVEML